MKIELFTKDGRRIAQFEGSRIDSKIEPSFSRSKMAGNCVGDVLTISFTATDESNRLLNFEMPINDLFGHLNKACNDLSVEKIDAKLASISESSLLRPILNERKRTFAKLAQQFLIQELEEAHKNLTESTTSFLSILNQWAKK